LREPFVVMVDGEGAQRGSSKSKWKESSRAIPSGLQRHAWKLYHP
jgi:hypothetical protein